MKKYLLPLLAFGIVSSCSKSTDDPSPSIDKSKLMNKDWYWEGKQEPQFITIRFNSDSAVMTRCTWAVPPYRYSSENFEWSIIGKDSISLAGYHFKVFSLNDSVLVTGNWVVGDTSRTTFTTY